MGTENTTHGPNVVPQQLKIISKELPLITGSRQRTTRRVGQSQKRAKSALRQVKQEMKDVGATKSQCATSRSSVCPSSRASMTSRSSLSSHRSEYSTLSDPATDWEAWGKGKKKDQLHTGRKKLVIPK